MRLKEDKKKIRNDIIKYSRVYSDKLAGKTFLYVYWSNLSDCSFLHLTGAATDLSAKSFYKNAKNCIPTKNQFYFDTNHTYANAKRKLKYLERLDSLTN